MNYHFRNLIFEGGGIKGIAYAGALEVLEQKGILKDIKRVGGTSAGAITALLLALDFNIKEIKSILWETDFDKFMDSSWGVIRNMDRLLSEFGWYKGDYFKSWIGEIIKRKTGSSLTTFAELQKMNGSKALYLIGTNLSTGYAEILSNKHTPDMTLVEGVRISMSVPFFFTAVRNDREDVCVDGGVLENYPIKLFDRRSYVENYFSRTGYYESVNLSNERQSGDPYVFNMETLGFRLDSYKEIKVFEEMEEPERAPVSNFFHFVRRLVATMLDSQQNRHLHSDDWQRTVYIDTLGIRTLDFNIPDEEKNKLILSGKTYTEKYFEWFDNAEGNLANRPSGARNLIG
jgi:NTE family protein